MSRDTEKLNQEPQEEQQAIEAEIQPQVEMPEDFEDPEGKSGKWKIVKGEVEVKGKKVEVSYREKVIDLPRHRQEETGITRIRRRELLPPFPGEFHKNIKDKEYYNCEKKFDEVYKFLTNGRYPSIDTASHVFNLYAGSNLKKEENIQRFRQEQLYFQEIFPKEIPVDQDKVFHLPVSLFRTYQADKIKWYDTPVFIFGNKNRFFYQYNNILEQNGLPTSDTEGLEEFPTESEIISARFKSRSIKPLRWCHAECALVPTKRSLNVLFFETGDKDQEKQKEG